MVPTVVPVQKVVEDMVWAMEWKAGLEKIWCVISLCSFERPLFDEEANIGTFGGSDDDVTLHRITKAGDHATCERSTCERCCRPEQPRREREICDALRRVRYRK